MEKMRELGWYLTEQGFNLVSDCGAVKDVSKLIKKAIDLDLKEIGSGEGTINEGTLIVQIQKIRNVAAPKNNDDSREGGNSIIPRMLKLYLTDGKNNYQGLEIEHIISININTPPGTKFLLNSSNIITTHGMILLKPDNIACVLGGKVLNLIEKWELNKKLASHTRARSSDEGEGPPPWIPFGKKITKVTIEKDKQLKIKENYQNKDNSDFEVQRQDAIAEAARQGNKKVFGGGTKQLLDHSVQKIVDLGFSVEQAEYALKMNRNNVERALKLLQKNDNKHNSSNIRENRGKRSEKKLEETKPSSGKLSLFDFLENKLPTQIAATSKSYSTIHVNTNNENNNSNNTSDMIYDGLQFDRNQSNDQHHQQKKTQFNKGNSGEKKLNKTGRYQQTATIMTASSLHQCNDEIDDKLPKPINNRNHNHNTVYTTAVTCDNNSRPTKPPRFQKYQEYQYQQGDCNSKKFYNHTLIQLRSDCINNKISSKNEKLCNNQSRNQFTSNTINKVNLFSKYTQSLPGMEEKFCTTNDDNSFFESIQMSEPSNYRKFYFNNSTNNDTKKNSEEWIWKKGDQCMAKYWEDNKYYNAQVTAVSARTCVVQFKDFNNYEEVLQVDCIPLNTSDISQNFTTSSHNDHQLFSGKRNRLSRYNHNKNSTSNSIEYRRSSDNDNVKCQRDATTITKSTISERGQHQKKRIQQRITQAIYQPPAQRR